MGEVTYDVALASHDAVLRRSLGVRSGDRVIDVGCGSGSTTRLAARGAAPGGALGVDVSVAAVERARELAAAEGLTNAAFEVGDAQVHPFPEAHADVVVSRFGTMFFADPAAAFAHLARAALRPGGRLVMLVWQDADLQEWDLVLRAALGLDRHAGPNPFSLGAADPLRALLGSAGLTDVELTDVHAPVHYGQDVGAALAWVQGFTVVRDALGRLDGAASARAVERLAAALEAHRDDDGVHLDARSWLVTARRPGG